MDQNPEMKRDSNLRRMLTIGGLIGLGALGWYLIDLAIRSHHDDRPPIIVQGGSARIEVQYKDAKYNSKGEWKERGSSGIWEHQHPGKKPTKLYSTVFPVGGCAGYDDLRSKDLTLTLAKEDDVSKTWKFDVRIDGPHLVVALSNRADFSVTQPDAWSLVIEAQEKDSQTGQIVIVPTNLISVEAKGDSSKKCTFNGKVSFIQTAQFQ